jgi:FKBP-type peptidyl-prolyl cis-trans isomerase
MSVQTQIIMRKLCCLLFAWLPVMLTATPVAPASGSSTPATPAPTSVNPAHAPVQKSPAINTTGPGGSEYTEEQLLTQFGWFMGMRFQLSEAGLNQDQIAAILNGLTLSLNGKDAPLPMEAVGPRMSMYMQNKMQVARANAQKAAQIKETAFFASLRSKGVASTPSGLCYEIIQPGGEKKPSATDTVTVKYTGRLTDGKVFDSSDTKGKPAVFQVNRMIRGWAEGVQLIGVGGKIKLYVPFSLAYGPANQRNIPPFSTLEFEVELLDVVPTPVNPALVHPGPANLGPGHPMPGNPAPVGPPPSTRAPAGSAPVSAGPVSSAPAPATK